MLLALTGVLVGLIFGALALLVTAPAAHANHSVVEHVSQGVTGGNGAFTPEFRGMSTDGNVVVFETTEQLVSADTDTAADFYVRAGATTQVASAGPASTGPTHAQYLGMTPDGTAVIFYTRDALVAADTDSVEDSYMYRAGTTTLLTGPGPASCLPGQGFAFGWSDDASKVFFETRDRLDPADTDCNIDLYQYSAGAISLVQQGPGQTNFHGTSADGARIFFLTDEALVPEDTDSMMDIYRRDGSGLTLISIGPAGGNGAFNAFAFVGESVSPDGNRVYFRTADQLVAGDTDSAVDAYLWESGSIELVEMGADGQSFGFSADRTHILFTTSTPLVAADTDTRFDIYEHAAGVTTLVSTGPAGGNDAFDVVRFLGGVSNDADRVFFMTNEQLVASDFDSQQDVYLREAGTTSLVSAGPTGAPFSAAFFHGASADGARAFFTTNASLVSADTDSQYDVYERAGSALSLVSGGNGPFDVIGTSTPMVSADGTRVSFYTSELLGPSDTDASRDIYSAGIGPVAGYPRPRGATPLRVALVPAYALCAAPNMTHGPPLAFGSCNPPAPASGHLTVGSPDANARAAESEAFAKYEVIVGDPGTFSDEADVALQVRITDVRVRSSLADYTGTLSARSTVRITDKQSGTGVEPATLTDRDLRVTVPCAATAGAAGATCSVSTTFDAITPGMVSESGRAIWELGAVQVFDGGSDGNAASEPNTLFATQGLFVP